MSEPTICYTCLRLREELCDGEKGQTACAWYKRMTNGDRVRAMTDEELAKWLCKIHGTCAEWCANAKDCDGDNCDSALLDWLKEEIPDNEN